MNPRERMILMIAVVFLGGVVWKFLIHDPQQAQYASLVQSRDAAQAELDRNMQILARGDQVRQEYARLSAFVTLMEAKLPSAKEIPALLTSMEQFTHRLAIGLESFHPTTLQAVTTSGATPPRTSGTAPSRGQRPAAKPLPYSKMDVNMGLTGTFSQTLAYLRGLHDLPRLVVVDGITMSPKEVPQLGVAIATEIYVIGAPGTAPAVATRP